MFLHLFVVVLEETEFYIPSSQKPCRYDFPAKRTATNTIVTFMAALNKQKCYLPTIVSDTSIGVVILPQVPLQIKYHSNHDTAEAFQSLWRLAMAPWRLTLRCSGSSCESALHFRTRIFEYSYAEISSSTNIFPCV